MGLYFEWLHGGSSSALAFRAVNGWIGHGLCQLWTKLQPRALILNRKGKIAARARNSREPCCRTCAVRQTNSLVSRRSLPEVEEFSQPLIQSVAAWFGLKPYEIGRSLNVNAQINDTLGLAYIEPNWKFKLNEIGDSVKNSAENPASNYSITLV